METRDIILTLTVVIAVLSFGFSIYSFIMTRRQRAVEDRRSIRKALTDVVDELTNVSIAYNELELRYPQSVARTIVSLRRNYNMRRRYLANHGEFLAAEIPELTSDVDYVSLAIAFEQGGDYTKAQRLYESAIEKAPTIT